MFISYIVYVGPSLQDETTTTNNPVCGSFSPSRIGLRKSVDAEAFSAASVFVTGSDWGRTWNVFQHFWFTWA